MGLGLLDTSAFSLKDIQNSISLLRLLHSASIVDITTALSVLNSKVILFKRDKPAMYSFKCPNCNGELLVSPVNISKCTNIGGSFKLQFYCPCGYERYSKLTLDQEMEQLITIKQC